MPAKAFDAQDAVFDEIIIIYVAPRGIERGKSSSNKALSGRIWRPLWGSQEQPFFYSYSKKNNVCIETSCFSSFGALAG